MRHMEVVGYDDYGTPILEGVDDGDDVEGDVMGDVMGHSYVVGRGRARRRGPNAGGGLVRVQRPAWRDGQLAPGVIAPDQGLLPLPMGNFLFTATAQIFTFLGQLQKPFRGERWLVSTVRTGASATGRLLAQPFVGTDLALLDVNPIDLEQIGANNAFGVRLTMKPAQPGVFIRAVTTLSNALTGTDTIFASVQLLGRLVH